MMEITLPVLPGETALRSAMAVLHGVRASGLITLRNGDPLLIKASAIVRAANHGGSTLADVDGVPVTTEVAPLQQSDRWTRSATVRESARDFDLGSDTEVFGGVFATNGSCDFVLSSLDAGRALVVTRHEGLGIPLAAAPQDCYCTNDESHRIDGGPPPCCAMSEGDIVECI
jgi:hypothetical protein